MATLSAVEMKNGIKSLKHTMEILGGDYTSDKFSSSHHEAYQISIPEGMSLTLYKNTDFSGNSRAYEGPITITIPNKKGPWGA